MNERWRVSVMGGSHQLQRDVGGAHVLVGYLDPKYAQEIVDTLNAVPIGHLQKQVAIMGDQVEDILARVTALQRAGR